MFKYKIECVSFRKTEDYDITELCPDHLVSRKKNARNFNPEWLARLVDEIEAGKDHGCIPDEKELLQINKNEHLFCVGIKYDRQTIRFEYVQPQESFRLSRKEFESNCKLIKIKEMMKRFSSSVQ